MAGSLTLLSIAVFLGALIILLGLWEVAGAIRDAARRFDRAGDDPQRSIWHDD